jgi:hypothetical protein
LTSAGVANEAQLDWERRAGRLAGPAALGSAAFTIASVAVQASASKDAPGRNDPDRHSQTLLSFHKHASSLLASAVLQAVATFLLAGALVYLYRVVRARRPETPTWVLPLVLLAPVLLSAAALINHFDVRSASDDFVKQRLTLTSSGAPASPSATQKRKALETCRRHRESRKPQLRAVCVRQKVREYQEDARANDLLKRHSSAGVGIGLAGGLAGALSLVLLSMNALRAGILSRFMGFLGVIAGALLVLPLFPVPVVQVFWLAALGLLFLDLWPGGRGPAWETGEAIPWPSARDRAQARVEEPSPEAPPPEEPERPKPSSRKRKRKKKKR